MMDEPRRGKRHSLDTCCTRKLARVAGSVEVVDCRYKHCSSERCHIPRKGRKIVTIASPIQAQLSGECVRALL